MIIQGDIAGAVGGIVDEVDPSTLDAHYPPASDSTNSIGWTGW
ncbi:MAG: hypothetical protein AAGN35_24205 [Bacteroidota bacterium]